MAKKKSKKKVTKKTAKKKVAKIDPAVRKEWLAKVKSDPITVVIDVNVEQLINALQSAPEEIKSDSEIVLAAVKQDGYALEYADKTMKSDSKIVLAAVKQCGSALQYADKTMKSEFKIVLAAVKQDGDALQYADKTMKSDSKIVLAAVKANGLALEYASKGLRNDLKIVLAAKKQLETEGLSAVRAHQLLEKLVGHPLPSQMKLRKELDMKQEKTVTASFDTSDMNLATLVVKKSEINSVEKLIPILTKFLEVDFEGERCEYPVFDDYLSFETDEGNTIAWKEKFEGHFDSPKSEEEITLFAYYDYAHGSYQLCEINPSSELTITTQEVDCIKIITGIYQDDGGPYYDCVDSSGYNETLIGFIVSDGTAFSVSTASYEDLDLLDYPKMASRISGDILDLMNKNTA